MPENMQRMEEREKERKKERRGEIMPSAHAQIGSDQKHQPWSHAS